MSLMKIRKEDYSYLDLPEFRKALCRGGDGLFFQFFVHGLRCGKCVHRIESLTAGGLDFLRVNLPARKLEVRLKHAEASLADIASRVSNLGFQLSPVDNDTELQKKSVNEDRQEIRRLAVAGFCASNIMIFSFAVYFGAPEQFKVLFEWLCFALYLPVVSFVAWPFYTNTWASLKSRKVSIDGPLALASLSGFAFSSVSLLLGTGSIYFDSLAGFLFLILLSRFVQKRLLRKYLNIQNGSGPIDYFKSRKLHSGDIWHWTLSRDLKVGDQIRIQKGEVITTDGELLSGTIEVDSSYFSGESRPIVKMPGMEVQGGTLLLSHDAILRVSKPVQETAFGRLLEKIQDQSQQKSEAQTQSDRYATVLVLSVFSLALLNIVFNLAGNWSESIERSLALIVLACPCAMAFGTPLALTFSLQHAFKSGFLLKSADLFHKISKIKNVFLDKTGTLTGSSLQVTSTVPAQMKEEWAGLVLGLEQQSSHPVGEALRKYLSAKGYLPKKIHELQEIDQGVAGFDNGKLYFVRTSEYMTGTKSVALFHRDKVLVHFILVDPILDSAFLLTKKLKERKKDIFLLSGDSPVEVEHIRRQLELPADRAFAGLSAFEKANRIEKYPQSMMVGDGMNDILALQKADVGVAVNGSIQMALEKADVFLLSQDISKIDELFEISKQAQISIQRNLGISLIYNVLGAGAALYGFINPFVAAVLMPISSGIILFMTWYGSRR